MALAFDDAMGFMLNLLKTVAYTGRLTINYKAPTQLHVPLVIHAWLGKRDGRNIFLDAELREDRPDASIIATASALFISINAY